ncbi:ABC transporter ATP-binding protein [Pseudoalteromonas sp. CO302Y]|uniref:ABC transporter ATP-binding protein n=1 Tax=unclassified Pseudoalteromonas TaxID=194690 RepID=UPI001023EEDF|nr:ABC transporter ATP-binding protein [Pseudoalteromonas sp. CO302Y]RZG11233.1 ABC transporter ATP-binding protein [Pseudoalteromonas sp. CO133X]
MITLSNVLFKWHSQQTTPTINIAQLQIDQGEHVFLHGPSGYGKSTLLSLLAGVATPNKGTIELLGKAINQLSNSQRDRFRADHIGYIFQNFNLLSYLSPIENVTLGCQFSTSRKHHALQNNATISAEASRLLTALGLTGSLQHQAVGELSIGQQQRVAAARAFIGSPEIIIADEPTSALDTQNRQAFVKLLFEQATATNSTLVFVSHDETLRSLFKRSIDLVELQGGRHATT